MERRGSGRATFVRSPQQAGFKVPRSGCRCPAPPAETHGGAWGSGSPATGLPAQGLSCDVLSLFALRPRTALLQPGLPRPGTTAPAARRQPQTPAESGRATGPSRPAAAVPAPPRATPRDGSGFTFDHLLGNICLWAGGSGCDDNRAGKCHLRAPALAAKRAGRAVAMPHLRAHRSVH